MEETERRGGWREDGGERDVVGIKLQHIHVPSSGKFDKGFSLAINARSPNC